jgi:aminopeptidase N
MPSNREQWMDEAFADYSAALFMKAGKKEYYDQAFNEWKSEAKDALQNGTIPTANQLSGDPMLTFRNRNGLIYYKGAYLLAALHEELGDVPFLTFLKSYQKNFRWKYGSTKNVIALLQFVTKKDYGAWFEENFYGTGLPDVKRK